MTNLLTDRTQPWHPDAPTPRFDAVVAEARARRTQTHPVEPLPINTFGEGVLMEIRVEDLREGDLLITGNCVRRVVSPAIVTQPNLEVIFNCQPWQSGDVTHTWHLPKGCAVMIVR